MSMDLTITLTTSIAGCTVIGVCLFFILIFYQEIKEFKDKPLGITMTANDSELRSISMSPLNKIENDYSRRTSNKRNSLTRKESEIILTPSNLVIDIEGTNEFGSIRNSISDFEYLQGITNEGFNESEVI